jgi:tRNA threonylcarbamoyl adenosine modification protein (Sua5/YciO/YrdC/YwlC family)
MVLSNSDPEIIVKTVRILNNGGIVIIKCDTIYGITGIYRQTESRIAEIKERAPQKPFIYLIADTEWIPRYSSINVPEKLGKYWPGPLTMIFPGKLPDNKSIAMRLPRDAFLLEILQNIGKPLISTSVNKEGLSPLNSVNEIIKNFGKKADLIIDSGDIPEKNTVSTLIDLRTKPFRILRQGGLHIPDEELV